MTGTREKVNAIFLAAIMVISMAAMGAAGFAGSAVAQEAGNGEAILFDGAEQIETFDGDRPIQNAINAIDGEAEPRVEVGPGTYKESVTIDKDVIIRGQGKSTVIESPDVLNSIGERDFGDNTRSVYTPLFISDAANVTVADLSVDGRNRGSYGNAFFGIYVENSTGSITDVTVTNTTQGADGTPSGNQFNYGIYVSNRESASHSFRIEDTIVRSFGKNGIRTEATDAEDLSVDVENNTIVGAGPTPAVAQNGLSLVSVSGTVRDNTIEQLGYVSDGGIASGLISTSDLGEIEFIGNTLRASTDGNGSNVGMYLSGDSVSLNENRFIGTDFALFVNDELNTLNLTNNTFRDQSVALLLGNTETISLSENTFENNTRHLRDLDAESELSNIVENNTFDSAAFVESGSEFVYSSIQDAVSGDRLSGGGASAGDTIIIEPGSYDENVIINTENITLEGPNAGVAGDDDARGSEAIITGGSTDTPGVRVIADEVTVDGLQIENPGQDGVRFGPDTVPSNVTIQNNVITNIAGSEFAETQSAANGIQFQFASGDPNGQTASNIRILDNEISNVSAPSNSGELTATGINVLPRGNDIDGLEIDGNTISNIKPGSGNPGEARGIIFDTQKDDPDRSSASAGAAGAVSGLSITDNEFTNLAGDDVNVISLFEDSRINPRIGPENFKIVNNDISNLDGTNDEFAVFIGGYETLGADHEVSQNNFRDGAIVRFSESQSGFDSSAADTLNATSNWWGASSGPSGQGPGSGSAVSANVTFEPFYIDAAKQTLRVDVNDESVENASRTNVGGDGSATVTVGGRDVQSTTVTLPSGSSATSVTVGEASAPTGSARGSEPENDVATYLDVSADSEVDDSVDISVTVEKSTLSDAGIATEDAVILHYVDGAWTELETTPSTGGGTVTLTATATGLSPFAVGAAAADPAGSGSDTGSLSGEIAAGDTSVTERISLGPVREVTVGFAEATTGSVRIERVDGFPVSAPTPDRQVLSTIDIAPPAEAANAPGSVEVTISRTAVSDAGTSPSELRFVRYDESDDELETLNTDVVSADKQTIVLSADTPGFSVFGVVVAEQTTATATPTATTTPGPTATVSRTETATPTRTPVEESTSPDAVTETPTSTEGSGPGFGAIVAVLSLIAAALLAGRRDE